MKKILRKGNTTLEIVVGEEYNDVNATETEIDLNFEVLIFSTILKPIDDSREMDADCCFYNDNEISQVILRNDKYIKDKFVSFIKVHSQKIKEFKLRLIYKKKKYLYKVKLDEIKIDGDSIIFNSIEKS